MNRQSIHQQIESLLKIIQDQHNQVKQHDSAIPQVEIDFMIQNLRQLYEAGLMLNHTNALSYLDEVKSAITQKILAEKRAIELRHTEEKREVKREEVVQEPKTISSNPEIKPVAKVVEIVTIETTATTQENPKEQRPAGAKTRKSKDLNSSLYEDKPTLGDKFENEETIHVKIASKSSGKTVADKLHHHPIKDLKTAIGINEKFLFINQLFEGNLKQYSEAIEKVNSFNDFESAKQFISIEFSSRLNWDTNNEHVRTFMELIERRFI